LRVALEPSAYAELSAHAKESLDAEVCGALAGDLCEDEDGCFVHVKAAIRGTLARQGGAHVTFTQETWNAIHQTLEEDFPKLKIVGWYHSHPGFGVEFSDMDLFIQEHFFPAPCQIAIVTDPLGGDIAVCANTASGRQCLERIWVDGREQRCRRPAVDSGGDRTTDHNDAGLATEALDTIEARLGQVVRELDDLRTALYRFLLAAGIVVCLGVVVLITHTIYRQFTSTMEPPRLRNYAPLPVKIGDDNVMLGVGLMEWSVPPKLNAIYLQLEREKREAARRAAEKAAAEKARLQEKQQRTETQEKKHD